MDGSELLGVGRVQHGDDVDVIPPPRADLSSDCIEVRRALACLMLREQTTLGRPSAWSPSPAEAEPCTRAASAISCSNWPTAAAEAAASSWG